MLNENNSVIHRAMAKMQNQEIKLPKNLDSTALVPKLTKSTSGDKSKDFLIRLVEKLGT